MYTTLFFVHSAMLLFFGVFLSSAFAGVQFSKKNLITLFIFCVFTGLLQLVLYSISQEEIVRKLYPFIVHLPVLLLLCFLFKKRMSTSIASVSTAYLCCQPAKWLGVTFLALTNNPIIEYSVQICVLIIVGIISLTILTPYLSATFNDNSRSVLLLGLIPVVYYIFDYLTVVYTDFGITYNSVTMEFQTFLLSIVFLIFCVMYYRESEERANAERKEQVFRITAEQQAKEIDAVKRSEQKIRIIRHDMRLLLNNIAMCIENDDKETARKLISGYTTTIDATTVQKYCNNMTINYIFSDFSARCEELHIKFIYQIELGKLSCDEVMLSTIISNALDNALNAQKLLPESERKINVLLRTHNDKTLFSVTNPYKNKPVFKDGKPFSQKTGHGYGSQSILYLAENMGGTCQFLMDENNFIVRVLIP